MLKIGEFARLSQVSLKTLRYYDALGILRPSQIDPESGYRLYEMSQLTDMMRIQALKDCGLSLDEIAQLLQHNDAAAIETLLNERVAAQQQVVAEEQARLKRMIARVKQLASTENVPPYDFVLKRTEPLTLVGKRQRIQSTEEIGGFVWLVLSVFEQQMLVPVGPLIHVYYDMNGFDEGVDLFVGAGVAAIPATITDLSCERLSGGEDVACALHRGDYDTISSAYIALNLWLSTSGYHRSGPCREIYHRSPAETTDSDSYLTEIQIPVRAGREQSISIEEAI